MSSLIIRSTDRQSNSGYHRSGKKTWWVRIGDRFLDIPKVRGDQYLSCEVDVHPGTKVQIGVGRRDRDGVRETVTTQPLPVADPTFDPIALGM
jgi:hypothetical protein